MDQAKRDWKIFQEKLPVWQNRYMEQILASYSAMIAGSGTPRERFMALDTQIRQDRLKAGVRMSPEKDYMFYDLVRLIREGVITETDLDAFSDELRGTIRSLLEAGARDREEQENTL